MAAQHSVHLPQCWRRSRPAHGQSPPPSPPGKGAHARQHGQVLLVAQHARHANVADLGSAVPRQQDVGCAWVGRAGNLSSDPLEFRFRPRSDGDAAWLLASLVVRLRAASASASAARPAASPRILTALQVQVHDTALVQVVQPFGHVKQHAPAAAGVRGGSGGVQGGVRGSARGVQPQRAAAGHARQLRGSTTEGCRSAVVGPQAS